ncbi:MAG TPA: hypothetical protein VKJ07_12115, partial [Mycobacteriales bacterium]|nr:hypothetical protein [Mycobacteriales bacterium]
PARIQTLDGVVREDGNLVFNDSTNQPSPGGSNIGVASAFAPTGLTGATQVTRYVGGVATVAPTTGTFAIGDYVISRNGKVFVCTVAGSPGTWVEPASLTFAPLASPTFTGTVAVPAAAAATSAPQLDQLTSALTITASTLPNTGAWASTTAKQNPTTVTTPARQVTINVEFVTDATNALASCAIAISPDNSTYTTIGTATLAAALNNLGAVKFVVPVHLPAAWWIKLTFAQGTVAASIYY